MKHLRLGPALFILATSLCAACGSGNNSSPAPPPVPAVCGGAFNTDDSTTAALRKDAKDAAAVALSSCSRDAQSNVVIGGRRRLRPGRGRRQELHRSQHARQDHDQRRRQAGVSRSERPGSAHAGHARDGDGRHRDQQRRPLLGRGRPGCPIGYSSRRARQDHLHRRARPPAAIRAQGCDDGSVKGIEVRPGGILRLYGAKGVPSPDPAAGAPGVSWTVLSAPVPRRARRRCTWPPT